MARLWRDADKRRAFMLSLVLHLSLLLLLVWYLTLPKPVPLESFLVIDVGEPQLAEEVTQAPAADAPAPPSATPQVEAAEVGAPVATAPEPAPPSASAAAEAQPEAQPTVQEEVQTATQAEVQPETPAPEPAEAVAEPTPEPSPDPDVQAATPPPPAPVVPAAPPLETELPRETLSATTLPEIDEPDIAPQPLVPSLPIPQPTAEAAVTPARAVAVTPSAAVTPREAIPQPQVEAQVADAEPVPVPPVKSTVARAQPVPTPQVSAQVAAAEPVPQPQVAASVTPARAVPTPNVSASVAAERSVPTPSVSASVAAGRAVAVTPQASVAAAQTIPAPQVSAAVAPTPGSSGQTSSQSAANQNGTGSAAETPSDAVRAERAAPGQNAQVTPGGNASAPGQTTTEAATTENLGLAAGPEGSPTPSGAPRVRAPYTETLTQPLAVMIDNARGYPQSGLLEASMIIEMPVEGGLTRLMTVYDRPGREPARVGPVRSTREYFVELVGGMNGVLVHDGGSPGALAAIDRSALPTLNAYTSGALFSRSNDRNAPYNLYSRGGELRQAMRQLGQNAQRAVSGTIFRPDETAEPASTITARFSGAYSSAFRYVRDLDSYRWVRNGEDAVDGGGQAVRVQAVLIARVEARPIPDDPEGRLYLPLRGGPATLYLRGRAIPGRWEPQDGVRFVSSLGEIIDLAPFKTWVAFVPSDAAVTAE